MTTAMLTVETLLIVGLCAVFGVVGFYTIKSMLYQRYEFYITDMLDYVSSMIDTDDLAECMRTGEKSEKYLELQKFLDNYKDHHRIAYIYVIKPLNDSDNDNIMNVIAALSTYEKEFQPENEVGLNELTGNSYTPEVARLYLDAAKKIDKVSFFEDYTEEWGNAYTGILPLVTSSGEYLAVLCVDIWINDIGDVLSLYISSVLGIMIVLGALCVMGNMIWLGKRVIIPVIELGKCMRTFADSNSEDPDADPVVIDPGIHTGDEMQTLSEQTLDMMEKLKKHIERTRTITAEKERISAELGVATKLQADMLPKNFPKRKDIELYATMSPAREMGGDFYDFFMIDDDHIGLVIADVSGKGIPAAMFMIVARTLMKIRTVAPGKPSEMLRDINVKLCEDNPSDLFVTIWFGILTLSTGELISSNAGHEYPALMRSGGEYELLGSDNMPPVATVEDIKYTDDVMTLREGDRLFLYTDGVPEAKNSEGNRFGIDKMLDILNCSKDETPEELLENIQKEINAFVGECEPFDDVTMMSLFWKGKSE